MKVTFLTNFINHHQVPLADEMALLLGDDYKMVTFEPIPIEFLKRGYADYSSREYHVKGYKRENEPLVHSLVVNSDIVLHGDAPEIWLQERMKLNKITIRYGERLFKKIDGRFIRFSFWKQLYLNHTRYRKAPLYMLGASAYNRLDTSLILSYPNKVYKWGYFTAVPRLDIDEIWDSKPISQIKILWCGTISQVKRPDLVPKLARKLKKCNIEFKITMIGSGALDSMIAEQIEEFDVADKVELIGNVPNDVLLQKMREYHIFIFTSNYGEGWGAVVNEAMSNGCAVVVSNMVGCAPFLIQSGVNGLIFRSGNVKDLFHKVREYIRHPQLMRSCSVNAYKTMCDSWNPRVAAANFIKLSEDIISHNKVEIKDGPCSIAKLCI